MIPLFKVHAPPWEALEGPLKQTLYSGYWSEGAKVKQFEAMLAQMFSKQLGQPVGPDKMLATNSCTSALNLAYRLAGVERGTCVLAPPVSCFATFSGLLDLGAEIVWCDTREDGNIDCDSARKTIKHDPRIRAIVAISWGGQFITGLEELYETCKEHGVKLIVDAAHALGTTDLIPHADYLAYSFQAIKHCPIGDGGALLINDEEQIKRGRKLRWFGVDRDAGDQRMLQDIKEHGQKWHLNDVLATIGCVQLEDIEDIFKKYTANARFYDAALDVLIRDGSDWETSYVWEHEVPWLYTLLAPNSAARLRFRERMQQHGIETSQVHRRCDTHSCMSKFKRPQLPGVDRFDSCAVCIPVHWALTQEERQKIVDAVLEFCNK